MCIPWTYNISESVVGSNGFSGGSEVKNLFANAGDVGLIPGSGRCPGGGHGKPLQHSCLGNPMNRGAWWATAYGSQRVELNLSTKQQWDQNGKGLLKGLCWEFPG